MKPFPTTVYTNAETHIEIRAPVGGRKYLEIVNDDAAEILFAEDTMATPENGLPVAANTSRSWAYDASQCAVPQGSIWLLGSAAAPALQKVIVRQG